MKYSILPKIVGLLYSVNISLAQSIKLSAWSLSPNPIKASTKNKLIKPTLYIWLKSLFIARERFKL